MRSAAELKDLFGLDEVRRIEVQILKSKSFKALMSFSAFSRHARQEISQRFLRKTQDRLFPFAQDDTPLGFHGDGFEQLL